MNLPNSDDFARAHQVMVELGAKIGDTLVKVAPAVDSGEGYPALDDRYVEDLAECFQIVIAEALQSWLDAGSERDVTMEDDVLRSGLLHALREWVIA